MLVIYSLANKYLYKCKIFLTFTVPHWFNDVVLDAEDDGGDDDGCQGGLHQSELSTAALHQSQLTLGMKAV